VNSSLLVYTNTVPPLILADFSTWNFLSHQYDVIVDTSLVLYTRMHICTYMHIHIVLQALMFQIPSVISLHGL